MRYILNVSMIIFSTLAFSQEKMNLLDYATNYVEFEKDDVQIINGLLYTNSYFNPKLLSGDIKVLDYYNSGKLYSEEYYEDGELTWIWYFFENGRISDLISYKNGKRHGFTREYCNDCRSAKYLLYEVEYKNGVKHGLERYWYANGRLFVEENYENGLKEGEHKTYYLNGNLQTKGNYYYDNREGLWIHYRKNGSRHYTEYY